MLIHCKSDEGTKIHLVLLGSGRILLRILLRILHVLFRQSVATPLLNRLKTKQSRVILVLRLLFQVGLYYQG